MSFFDLYPLTNSFALVICFLSDMKKTGQGGGDAPM